MSELFFHTPWWFPTLIGVIGIGLFIAGNNRQQAKLRTAGAAVFLLAIAVVVMSYLVDTDIEKVSDRTDALLASIEDRNWDKFRSLLAPNTSGLIYHGRDQLTAGAKAGAEKFNVKKVRVLSREINATGSLITVSVNAYTEQDMPPGPLRTGWQFDWQQHGNEWLLSEIRLVSINNEPANNIDNMLPSVMSK